MEELAGGGRRQESAEKLSCLIGAETRAALAAIVEIGDFARFSKAEKLAAFMGLAPSGDSGGGKQSRGSITKAGNSHAGGFWRNRRKAAQDERRAANQRS
jgi:transposase